MRWMLASFIFVLTATCMLAEERVEVDHSISGRAAEEQLHNNKRISIDDVAFDTETEPERPKQKSRVFFSRDAANPTYRNFPIVLPPYGYDGITYPVGNGQCMMYLENITVVVLDQGSIKGKHYAYTVTVGGNSTDQFGYDESYVSCPAFNDQKANKTTFDFTVDIKLGSPSVAMYDDKPVFEVSGPLKITLHFNESFGLNFLSADLDAITINVKDQNLIKGSLNPTGKNRPDTNTNIRSYFRYNFACSSTQAIWFDGAQGNNHTGYLVGIVFNNIQIQSYFLSNATKSNNKVMPIFSSLTADCQPTFSPGSWMGIIVTLVLVTVLMFGFLMLNSVQTMDRFDDPKQKQIVINFKE